MNDIFENYKPPITVYSDFENQILQEQENQIMCKIKNVVDIDKNELIKMVNYDRKQYEAGYKAGVQKMRQHGHWIYDIECECYYCSNCKAAALNNYRLLSTKSEFCPNCGAIMGEVSEDENI